MNYRRLFIFVEGDDDERFFQQILIPRFQHKYDDIKIIQYAQKAKKIEYLKKFIYSVRSMGAEYIYVTDINNLPCVTAKKQGIQESLNFINNNCILVVIREIESWYLAGLDNHSAANLHIKNIPNHTDGITKEQFYGFMPNKFDSRIDFMMEILKNYSVDIAEQKNRSFRYCLNKYDC